MRFVCLILLVSGCADTGGWSWDDGCEPPWPRRFDAASTGHCGQCPVDADGTCTASPSVCYRLAEPTDGQVYRCYWAVDGCDQAVLDNGLMCRDIEPADWLDVVDMTAAEAAADPSLVAFSP